MSDKAGLRIPKPGYRLFKTKSWAVFTEGVWHNNPIFGMVLGLCSTLAVTNLMVNAVVMSASVTIILVLNSLIISLLRKIIPEKVRMIAYMLLVSSFVIAVDMVLRIVLPSVSKALGPYIALIITNCIIMGRAEAYAINNPPGVAVVDALGVGLGYSFSLLIISLFRELIGFGSILGMKLLPEGAQALTLFTIPPGAFFALGIFILVINTIRKEKK